MKKENTNNIRLGLFVILGTILFIVAIYKIGQRQSLFGSTFVLTSYFNNVQGLQTGNNVRYTGINVGAIQDITIANDSLIRVDMRIDKKVQRFIRRSAIASITTDGLVGNKVLNIEPALNNSDRSADRVKDGDVIVSQENAMAADMMSTLEGTNDQIAILSNQLVKIATEIVDGDGTINRLLTDKNTADDLSATLKQLNQISKDMTSIAIDVRAAISDMNKGQGNMGYLLRDSTLKYQITDLIESIDNQILGEAKPIMDNLNQASVDINVLTHRLDSMMSTINLENGVIGTLLYDSLSHNELRDMIHNMNEGTDKFNQSMEALKHNFLLRGYFKKQEKLKAKLEKEQASK